MAKAALWNETADARRILAGLTADDVYLQACYGVGPGCDHYIWSIPGHHDALNETRTSAVERAFGCTFQEASAESSERARAYLAADALQPSVSDVLAAIFGDPDQFGPVPGILNRSSDTNPERARAHVAAVIAADERELAA